MSQTPKSPAIKFKISPILINPIDINKSSPRSKKAKIKSKRSLSAKNFKRNTYDILSEINRNLKILLVNNEMSEEVLKSSIVEIIKRGFNFLFSCCKSSQIDQSTELKL